MKLTARRICRDALGIALFVVLSFCIHVPVFENYYLCLGYVALVVYAGLFGGASGALVGGGGVILYCLLTSGLRGMPGWAAGNVLIGLGLGFGFSRMKPGRPLAGQTLLMGAWMLILAGAAMLGVKSLTECLLYGQPMALRITKNFYAFAADTFVMWLALPVYHLLRTRAAGILPKTA